MKQISTEKEFYEIINQDSQTVVKFETDWCPDCKRLDMFIGDIIEENNEKQWYQINKDELPEIAEKYEVMGIPSLLVYEKGVKKGHLHSANAKSPESVRDFFENQ